LTRIPNNKLDTAPIRRNLTGNTFVNRNRADREWIQEREQNRNGTGTERVQNGYRTDTERKWNGYGTVTNHKNGKKLSPESKP